MALFNIIYNNGISITDEGENELDVYLRHRGDVGVIISIEECGQEEQYQQIVGEE